MRKILTALAALALVWVGSSVAYAQPPSPLVQICAATDVEAVDSILANVASSGIVGELAPLATLVVPTSPTGVELKTDTDLGDVRSALNCAPVATTTPVVPPTTTTPAPTTTAPPIALPDNSTCDDYATPALAQEAFLAGNTQLDGDNDGIACELDESLGDGEAPATNPQVDRVPRGGIDTGDGSTLK